MKKVLLLLVLASLTFVSCSTDDTSTADMPNNSHSALRAGYWDGAIGVDNGNGNFQFLVNPQWLIKDLNIHLAQQGDNVMLQTIQIVGKKAFNDNTDGYMLIGSDNANTSVGLMLDRTSNGLLQLHRGLSDPDPSTIMCRGCSTGCNLEYLNMPGGGKQPYCNTNGCGDYCQTKYATLN